MGKRLIHLGFVFRTEHNHMEFNFIKFRLMQKKKKYIYIITFL